MALASCLLFNACAFTPTTVVKQPLTAKPTAAAPVQSNNGAIFNVAAYRPLFEDRRPRFVGDVVTINIVENTNTIKNSESTGSKDGKADNAITSFLGHAVPNASFAGKSANSYKEKDDSKASNVFNGSITVTVIEVLPNGNLSVSGEKQISFDKGTEFVRFSGVVSPDTITVGNFVPSNRVADARIEYRTNTKVDAANIAAMVARFFLSMAAL
ncbi:MAG: flagellar basal body L-ring protein FlgH [Methylotenera sp.]|uniref:flagellar basal body L-ring protein FlgH n=1 Tax=Methylotenera sp. TaxID=2051956 RepID=UPI002489FE39|nr:flagellar basal body L-ring protein FlgH [Methylotenera sp.]MDI1308045.1 flagellar basal body L-ring protein FlgH [Methylotenera sp.]